MSKNEGWAVDDLDEIVWRDPDGFEYPLAEIHHAGTPYNVAVRAKAALRAQIAGDR